VTYDGATIRLYVNGAQVATKSVSGTINSSTAPLRFGGDSVWGEYFNGLIDEVRVYSTVLTAAQITTDMNTPVGGGGGAQLADRPAATGRRGVPLSPAEVGPALRAALSLWAKAGVPAGMLPVVQAIHVHLGDLPGSGLGFTDAATDQIWLDQTAAGYGWNPDRGGFDLKTVLAHEVGHLLGIADLPAGTAGPADLMNQTIAPGEVRRPSALDVRLATVGAYPSRRAGALAADGQALSSFGPSVAEPAAPFDGGLPAVRLDQHTATGSTTGTTLRLDPPAAGSSPAAVQRSDERPGKSSWTDKPLTTDSTVDPE
jgi:hypothetical protein